MSSCLSHGIRLSAIAAILLQGAPLGTASAQQFAWIGTIGVDTAVIEMGELSRDKVTGTIINIAAGMVVQSYEAELDERGGLRTLRVWRVSDLDVDPTDDETPSLFMDFTGDAIAMFRQQGDSAVKSLASAPSPAFPVLDPFFNGPMAIMDLALQGAVGSPSNQLSLYYVGGESASTFNAERLADGRLVLPYQLAERFPMLAGARLMATMDADGMQSFDARETTFKILTQRGEYTEPLALARSLKARGLGSGGFSSLSPPAATESDVDGTSIRITYGQPSRRGRNIFPDVVELDKVWRAGANAATRMMISGDLKFGGHLVPAGSYSLWVIPGVSTDSLIINTADRVWGTSYDGSTDLVRLPMMRQLLASPVEQLTFSIADGQLQLAWGDRRMSVAVESVD